MNYDKQWKKYLKLKTYPEPLKTYLFFVCITNLKTLYVSDML